MKGPVPHAPSWAVKDGLPEPTPGETFTAYCSRLGIASAKIAEMLAGLDERTSENANTRLGTYLYRTLRERGTDAAIRGNVRPWGRRWRRDQV